MSQNSQTVDAISYAGLPVVRSQPEYLETVARLRGMQPAATSRARVLELGCGAGGNLLPLADRYPESRFVGIDRSARQIEIAQQVARELSLENVEFRSQHLLELNAALGTFDYIIANGIYSWVDAPLREKLLAVCRDHLAPQGIAYVSYKTYPGWAVHEMFRNMMLYDAREASNATEKIARARMFLEFLDASLSENEPYGALLHGELAALKKQSDEYLLHDHLEEFSHPVYFPDFAQHARTFSLQTAGDGVLGIRRRDYLGEVLERQLDAITTDDAERELYRDVVYGRTVRQTLLCHEAVSLPNSVTPEMLGGLYLAGALRAAAAQVDIGSSAVAQFSNRAGTQISTKLPLVKAALLHLSEAWPDYVRYEDCVPAACARLETAGFPMPIPAEEIERLEKNLTQCCAGGGLELHSERPSYTPRASDKPAASPLVRWQARRGEVVANRRHEPVRLEMFERCLIDLLDGTRDQAALTELLAAAASQGQLIVTEHQQPVRSHEDTRRALGIALPEALTRLARSALLVA
jgi:SAM-dependent methyltransferase/methyltransferase-like protein